MFPSVNNKCTQNVSPETIECENNLPSCDHHLQRPNLAGGSGVFSHFFKEMAEPNSIPDVSTGGCTKGGCNRDANAQYEQVVQYLEDPSVEEDPDLLQAFYCRYHEDEDLGILNQYSNFIKRFSDEETHLPFKESPGLWDCYAAAAGGGGYSAAGYPAPTASSPIDLAEYLAAVDQESGISYPPPHRCKPPKVLANRFLLGETVGRGSYGKVKDAIDLVTLKRHAVKVISRLAVRKIPGGWHQALLEAAVMRRLGSHCNIVSLVTVLHVDQPSERLCLVMEHCLGSVHDLQAAGVPFLTENDEDDEHVDAEFLGLDAAGVPPANSTSQGSRNASVKPRRRIPWLMGRPKRCSTQIQMPGSTDDNNGEDGGLLLADALRPRKVSDVEFSRFNGKKWTVNGRRGNHAHQQHQQQQPPQQQFRRLSEAQSHAFFLQLLEGLSFLHRNGVIHRDIKPANLLLTRLPGCGLSSQSYPYDQQQAEESLCLSVDCTTPTTTGLADGGRLTLTGRPFASLLALSRGWLVKLTDFGVSASLSAFSVADTVSGGQTTPAVQPPEVAKGMQSTFAGAQLDVYSAGVTLYFMLTGRVPFSCANVLQIFEAIAQGDYTIPGHVSADAAGLVRKMMMKDPKKRFSLEKVSRHPWVQANPSPPLALAGIRRRLRSLLSSTGSSGTGQGWPANRGFVTWLDPLVYLKRPFADYPLPHIDENGARIFSLGELDRLLPGQSEGLVEEQGQAEEEQGTDEDSLVAPSCFAERLKVYHVWREVTTSTVSTPMMPGPPPADAGRFALTTVANACCGIEPRLAELDLSAPVVRPEYVPCHAAALPSDELGLRFEPARTRGSPTPPPVRKHRQRGQTISLPACGRPTSRDTAGLSVGEPPLCPADLPVAPPSLLRPPAAMTVEPGGKMRAASFSGSESVAPTAPAGNQKTWHSGIRPTSELVDSLRGAPKVSFDTGQDDDDGDGDGDADELPEEAEERDYFNFSLSDDMVTSSSPAGIACGSSSLPSGRQVVRRRFTNLLSQSLSSLRRRFTRHFGQRSGKQQQHDDNERNNNGGPVVRRTESDQVMSPARVTSLPAVATVSSMQSSLSSSCPGDAEKQRMRKRARRSRRNPGEEDTSQRPPSCSFFPARFRLSRRKP